ncbi:hypothetical protein F5146DRAFT_1003906 [Armillaria mellea]|nr:hypothetical protein F5146DRAFT_1003906 [Armillaria mellea]
MPCLPLCYRRHRITASVGKSSVREEYTGPRCGGENAKRGIFFEDGIVVFELPVTMAARGAEMLSQGGITALINRTQLGQRVELLRVYVPPVEEFKPMGGSAHRVMAVRAKMDGERLCCCGRRRIAGADVIEHSRWHREGNGSRSWTGCNSWIGAWGALGNLNFRHESDGQFISPLENYVRSVEKISGERRKEVKQQAHYRAACTTGTSPVASAPAWYMKSQALWRRSARIEIPTRMERVGRKECMRAGFVTRVVGEEESKLGCQTSRSRTRGSSQPWVKGRKKFNVFMGA